MPFACKEAEKMPYNANTRAAEGRKRRENVDLRIERKKLRISEKSS